MERRPLVLDGAFLRELPAGDTLPGVKRVEFSIHGKPSATLGKVPYGIVKYAFTPTVAKAAAFSLTPATDTKVFPLFNGNTQIGTMTFPADSNAGMFEFTGSFTEGSGFYVGLPSIQDATLSGITAYIEATPATQSGENVDIVGGA